MAVTTDDTIRRVLEGGIRAVVVVEGNSDRIAVEALAARRGLDLVAARVAVVPVGGAHGTGRFLEQLRVAHPDVDLTGLCDSGEERHFRHALERTGFEANLYVCLPDLEGELIRALGASAVEAVLAANGDLGPFRTLQNQPEWRGRPVEDQLRRFMGSGSGRKPKYARLLVDALDLARVPQPLDGVLAHIERIMCHR